MSKEVKGIVISRLIVLLSIIVVPILIFLIFNITPFTLWFSEDVVLNGLIIQFLTPLTFSISWLYFLILFANRFSVTIESMEKTINIIPLRLKIFYGFNAMFVLFIFVFPLITPLISILSFVSMIWQLTTSKKDDWDENSKIPFITKLLMVIVAILPIFCTICIAPTYLELPIWLWDKIWIPLLEHIYTFSYCLCTSLAIGSLFVLIANRGVSEIEELWSDPLQKQNMFYIGVLELGLVGFFLYLAYAGPPDLITFFYNIGFVLVLLVSIVNYFSGRSKSKKFNSHVLGYILAATFMGSNLLLFNVFLSDFLKNMSLAILAAVFIIVFAYTFIRLPEETEF